MRSILCRQISGESIRGRESSEKALSLAIEEMERRQMRLQHARDRERVEGGEFGIEGETKSDER